MTRILKAHMYTGSTTQFWAVCDAICSPEAARSWGFVSCGKGDPIQLMAVGHGSSPARFRDVEISSAGGTL